MRGVASALVIATGLLTGCGESYSSGLDNGDVVVVSGSYRGIVSGTAGGEPFTANAILVLSRDTLNQVAGTLTTDAGSTAMLGGTVSILGIGFEMAQTSPCPGSFHGSASVAKGGDRLTGSYSGSSMCEGSVSASFVVDRD